MTYRIFLLALFPILISLTSCAEQVTTEGKKVARIPMTSHGPDSMDPVKGSSVYDNRACSLVYQTLLQYDYFQRPLKLKPLLLVKMPEISEDGKIYKFKLRDDVYFHDNECFQDGKGRKITSKDFFYSLKRMADSANGLKSWWLMDQAIVGFDKYKKKQNDKKAEIKRIQRERGLTEEEEESLKFDYDAPIDGMKVISDTEFEVHLNEPFFRFTYVLAMFQTSIVPKEAVEFYDKKFSKNPVGTGPFLLDNWIYGSHLTFVRNPKYKDRDERYPDDPGLNADGSEPYQGYKRDKKLGFYKDAGKQLPILDRIEINTYAESQPAWLKFRQKQIDYASVGDSNYDQVFIKRTGKLRGFLAEEGITYHLVPLLDMVYNGFNMEDLDYGGYDEKHKKIRQAISLCVDSDEKNRVFYNGDNIIYDGPIPPNMDGHPINHVLMTGFQGPDIARAKELLEEAGHPNGEGLPPLKYYTGQASSTKRMTEMFERHLKKIGIKLDTRIVDFPTLIKRMNSKEAPCFGLAWGSDYPDAENNLQLFYGPNKSPGSNNFNYDRDEYNEMYEKIRGMKPSPERTAIYKKMRDMIIEDSPIIGTMARSRKYLVNPRLKNFKPVEAFYNYGKYLNVED